MLNAIKEGVLEINETSMNRDLEEDDQEPRLLKDLRLQERYQGDQQGYPEKEVKGAIKMNSCL